MTEGQGRTNDSPFCGPLEAISATTGHQQLPDLLPADPFDLLHEWVEHAKAQRVQPNPTAMALATTDAQGWPNVRMVLCRGIDRREGSIWFFTNRRSVKGQELADNPRAAACFHWDALDRQARLRGRVQPLSEADSDAYFASRSWPKRIGAWASDQSSPVASRQALLDRLAEAMRRFGIDPDNPPPPDAQLDIPRPPHWGGMKIIAHEVELWVGSPTRIHDRARWTRSAAGQPQADEQAGVWTVTRLQP